MKINKLNIKLLTVALGLIAFSSCTDDDLDGMDTQPKPVATTTTTSLTLLEGESGVIPFTISRAINKVSQFKIVVLSGNAEQNVDYTAGDGDMDADTGVPHEGFEITVPAYATSFEIPVETIRDLDQTEGSETVQLQISAAGVRTILTPEPYYVVNLTILDYEYCPWTFEMTDLYGDGWNGGYLEVISEGETRQFAALDEDGAVNVPETTTVVVQISKDADFTINYVSGGGTGAGPGWESENVYTITAPDGTQYTDGPIPTEGEVVSGTCN